MPEREARILTLLPGCLVLLCEGEVRVGQTVLVGLVLGTARFVWKHRDAFELLP